MNASNLIAFTFLDASYEALLNEESSLCLGVLFNIGNDNFLDEYRTFSLTPIIFNISQKGMQKDSLSKDLAC